MSGASRAGGRGAVMASRMLPDTSLDFFPTPPWATRALVQRVLHRLHGGRFPLGRVQDPACGQGHMAEVLAKFSVQVIATDIFDYGYGAGGADFLAGGQAQTDWTVCNPPFKPAIEFTLRALEGSTEGVAMLCRTSWIEGSERYRRLFSVTPPTLFAPFVERVPMIAGRWDPDASSATAYAWFVWRFDGVGRGRRLRPPMPPYWIPPCRAELTLETDRARFAAWSLQPDRPAEIRSIAHGLCRADDQDPRSAVFVPAFQTLTYRERKAVASKLLSVRRRVPQWEARRREADDIVARRATIEALLARKAQAA